MPIYQRKKCVNFPLALVAAFACALILSLADTQTKELASYT